MIEVLGVSLIIFIAYLYLPAAVFRFGAEHYIDLQARNDTNEIEEFIASAIPSSTFHALTWLLLRIVSVVVRRPMPVVDWTWWASLISDEDRHYVFEAVSRHPEPTVVYFALSILVSFTVGLMYGRSFLDQLEGKFPADREPKRQSIDGLSRGRKAFEWTLHALKMLWYAVKEIVFAINFRIANFLQHEGTVWLFRWSVRQPTVFVRTRGERLYFGKFQTYQKKRTSEIDSIVLTDVWRYRYEEIDANVTEGRLPFADLGGSLRIVWNDITDIHEATPEHFQDLMDRQVNRRRFLKRGQLLRLFRGQTLGFEELYRKQSRGDWFTPELVEDALESLVIAGLVKEVIDAKGETKYVFPERAAAAGRTESPGMADRTLRDVRRLRKWIGSRARTGAQRRLSLDSLPDVDLEDGHA